MRIWNEVDHHNFRGAINERDKAITELWNALVTAYEPVSSIISAARGEEYTLSHPVIDKYREFVEKTGIHETG